MTAPQNNGPLYPELESYLRERAGELDRISPERREVLERLAEFVARELSAGRGARLTFVCTHNSRRSHMAQLWAEAAAAYHGTERVETFSGGTEATAVHPNALAALARAGFRIQTPGEGSNPVHEVSLGRSLEEHRLFSKLVTDPANPRSGFAAVMTCAEADAACPSVPGAAVRISLPYEDPKDWDGTAQETAAYDERCAQIGRELLYAFSAVASKRARAEG